MKLILLIFESFLAINLAYKRSLIRNFLCIFYILIISIQAGSYFFSGDFLPPVALGNLEHIHEIGNKSFIYGAITFIILFCLSIFLKNKKSLKSANFFLIFSLIFVIFISRYDLIGGNLASKQLFNACKDAYRENIVNRLDPDIRDRLRKSLLKSDIVYDSKASDFIDEKRYNILIFFIEGFSNRVISKELMPNIYALRNNSLQVINYYNHTASTYRGLRGQLSSFFQISSGYTSTGRGIMEVNKKEFDRRNSTSKDLTSIAQILNDNNYTTIFQMPNKLDSNFFDAFKSLGFKKFYGYESVKNPIKWSREELSDKDSFNLVLKNIASLKEPFFYAVYSVGTHFGIESEKKDIKFKSGDNNYLNIWHNFDYNFGKFFDEFKKLSIAKDTILIVTADHAAYPSKDFRKTFNSDNNSFIDKIPLIIYNPYIKKGIFDAKNLNSLSLAPTICDILGIREGQNRFLGFSLFDKETHPYVNYISAVGSKKYKVIDNKITRIDKDKNYKKEVEQILLYQKFGG